MGQTPIPRSLPSFAETADEIRDRQISRERDLFTGGFIDLAEYGKRVSEILSRTPQPPPLPIKPARPTCRHTKTAATTTTTSRSTCRRGRRGL